MNISVARQINAPLDTVFAVFSDIENAAQHLDGIQSIEILSDTRHGEGTRWRETRIMFGREATEAMEISKFEANKRYEVAAASRGMAYLSTYTFSEVNDGTLVTMTFKGTPTTLMARIMSTVFFFMAGSAKKALEADMDQLKAVCEEKATG